MWKITKDNLWEEDSSLRLELPNRAGIQSRDFEESKATEKFRMRDGDGVICYEGIADKKAEFDPLDDFGTPDSGCTEIQYLKENGRWETL